MGAARCIGRVGGLAVALGVGAAVFTGYGVAWAEPGSGGSSSSGSSSQSSSSSGSAAGGSANSGGSVASKIAGALKPARSTGAGSSGSASTGSTTSALPGVVVSTGAAGGLKLPKISLSPSSAPATGEPSFAPAKSAASSPTSSPTATDNPAPSGSVTADEVVVKPPSVSTLLSPHVAATQVTATVSTLTSAPNTLMPGASLVTMQPATPAPATTAPANASTVLATVVSEVLNPFAGNAPTGPVDPPTSWVLLAAVRREFSGAAVSLDPSNPITVTPTLTFDDGIVYGNANATDANGLPLAYTIVSDPNQGGKITFVPELAAGTFTYLPYQTVLTGTDEQFSELVSETTPFDARLEALPVVGSFVQPVLVKIYQVPVLSTALAPVIGAAVIVPFDSAEVPELTEGVPAAFTVKVISFDGTPISTNFYPASGLEPGQTAPTIFEGPGLASPGLTDPNSTDLGALRQDGYNVVTWDPRGEFASGGVLQVDSPAFEGRDVSALITWDAQLPETQLDGPNDPRMGMVGASYGGGIQLVAAGIDPRIDAIVPIVAWNSLNSSLYPNQAFKTSFATLLLLGLVETGARINPQLYGGIVTGDLLGILTPGQQALLAASGPDFLLNNITAPTLLIQGTVDVLFPLQQAVTNGQVISANGVPVKEIWFCGGHGTCQNPPSPIQDQIILADMLAWLDQYVMQDPSDPADAIPTFQWVDQTGQFYSSNLLPSDPNFNGTPIVASGTGGRLLIVPVVGGSGPSTAPIPQSLGDGAKAKNALNTTVSVPAETQIVGAPELTMTYSGVGTSRFVYAQIVDDNTGQVLGHVVTPIPVTLNGQTHTVTVPLDDIAYTAPPNEGDQLTLQITSSATAFENFTSFGTIDVTSVQLSLPTVGPDANATPENSAPSELATAA